MPKFVPVLEPRVTYHARLRFSTSIFSISSYFCMCIVELCFGNKPQFVLFTETKLHVQKYYSCQDIEKQTRMICYFTMVQ